MTTLLQQALDKIQELPEPSQKVVSEYVFRYRRTFGGRDVVKVK